MRLASKMRIDLSKGRINPIARFAVSIPVRVKSRNAHNEPIMSAFHPIATEIADAVLCRLCATAGLMHRFTRLGPSLLAY